MTEPSEEDIAWLKSTFHPIPKPALPDDCIEYSLYVVDSTLDPNNDSERRLSLRDVQKRANELQKTWLKDYIWQRQGFALETIKQDGLSNLHGRTEYGDSIEDEWVIVWLLRELTKTFPNLWIKITDSDGEFLLIEASGTLPAWLEPEVAENRVWINGGQLKIIKPANTVRSSKRTSEKISLQDAHHIILADPKRLMHSTSIEEEAFYRLRNYPTQIKENNHNALVKIPRKIAYLLQQKPAYISPAIEAFYLRDPIALKPLQAKDAKSSVLFPPDDLVNVSVAFPKVAYAQIKSQEFPTPTYWKGSMPAPGGQTTVAAAETGMKVSCGFEMLLGDSHYQDRSAVREMKLLLEDIDTGDATLPTDEDISKLVMKIDDEKWLDINFDDLQKELNKQGQDNSSGKKPEFADKAAQENLQRIVKQFEDFLNDENGEAGGEGLFAEDSDDDDLDDLESEEEGDDGEDKEASFDEDEFSKLMQEMMGMPPEVMKELMNGKIDAMSNGAAPSAPLVPGSSSTERVKELSASNSDSDKKDDNDDEDGEHIQSIMRQMESELRTTGVLDIGPQDSNKMASQRVIKKAKAKAEDVNSSDEEGEEVGDSDDDDDDIDMDLANHLLESFKLQGGKPGPTSTLMDLINKRNSSSSLPGPSKTK